MINRNREDKNKKDSSEKNVTSKVNKSPDKIEREHEQNRQIDPDADKDEILEKLS